MQEYIEVIIKTFSILNNSITNFKVAKEVLEIWVSYFSVHYSNKCVTQCVLFILDVFIGRELKLYVCYS